MGTSQFYLWRDGGQEEFVPETDKFRSPWVRVLLAHDYAHAAAPALRKTDAQDFYLRREIAQQLIRGRMKAQGRRDQVNEWRRRLQLHAGKISVTRKVFALPVMPHVPPVAGGLQSQVNVLGGFQFENGQPPASRDAKQIEDAVLAPGIGEDLRINETCIKLRVYARHILSNNRLQPAFRLRAIKRVPRVGGQRVAVRFEIIQQFVQRGPRSCAEFFVALAGSKEDVALVPPGKRKASETQPDLSGCHRRMHAYGARHQRYDGFEGRPGVVEQRLRLPPWHNPTVDISRRARIQSFQSFAHGIALVKLRSQLRTQCSDALRHDASAAFRQNESKARDGSAPV